MEEYWLKYGFKENGELVCVRTLSCNKPEKIFFYKNNENYVKVQNPNIIKLSCDNIKKFKGDANENCNKY